MRRPGAFLLVGLVWAAGAAWPAAGAQVDLELFAPAREAGQALQAARRARSAELAPHELRLADGYYEDAQAAFQPPSGTPDMERAMRLFRLAAAQARVAEARSIEIVREREAAAAGAQYLEAIEGDPKRMLPPRPPLGLAAAEYRRAQREAADARAARRQAEGARDELLRDRR